MSKDCSGKRKISSDTWDQEYAKRLKELFENETLNQTAQKLGCSSALVGFWKNGQSRPSYEMLIKISDIYDVSIDWILGNSNAKTRDTELNTISSKTGLSEDFILALTTIKNNPVMNTINALYKTGFLFNFLRAINGIKLEAELLSIEIQEIQDIFCNCNKNDIPALYDRLCQKIDMLKYAKYDLMECSLSYDSKYKNVLETAYNLLNDLCMKYSTLEAKGSDPDKEK